MPELKETIRIDEVSFDDDDEKPLVCPNCKKEIELDFSCDCDECGDDCDCGHDDRVSLFTNEKAGFAPQNGGYLQMQISFLIRKDT